MCSGAGALCACVCVCGGGGGLCVCVCVCERERERERAYVRVPRIVSTDKILLLINTSILHNYFKEPSERDHSF